MRGSGPTRGFTSGPTSACPRSRTRTPRARRGRGAEPELSPESGSSASCPRHRGRRMTVLMGVSPEKRMTIVKKHRPPDELRQMPHGNGQGAIVSVGAMTVVRGELQPSWRWSNDLRPMSAPRAASSGTPGSCSRLFPRHDGRRQRGRPRRGRRLGHPPDHDAWASAIRSYAPSTGPPPASSRSTRNRSRSAPRHDDKLIRDRTRHTHNRRVQHRRPSTEPGPTAPDRLRLPPGFSDHCEVTHGRASRIRFSGVAAARRIRVKPPSVRTARSRGSPACAPSPSPTSWAREVGVQNRVENP
jgi:hypothetical protein